MKWICAWCGKTGPDVPPLDKDRITHGICFSCLRKQMRKMKEARKEQEKEIIIIPLDKY